jgi:IS30 family transposase
MPKPLKDRDLIYRLLKSKMTVQDIARKVGCGIRTIERAAREAGIVPVNSWSPYDNKRANYLKLLRAGFPSKRRPLEDMSSAASNFMECDT